MGHIEDYEWIKSDPALHVGVKIMCDAIENYGKYETPPAAITTYGEKESHRFIAMDDFNRIVDNHLLAAPLNVDGLQALGRLLMAIPGHGPALIPHNVEGYMEITEIGMTICKSFLLGKMFHPDEVERRKREGIEQHRREDQARRQRWETLETKGRATVDAYISGTGPLSDALEALTAMKGGRWEKTQPDERGEWDGAYHIIKIIDEAWQRLKQQPAPPFDYSMKPEFGDKPVFPGINWRGELPIEYRPDLIKIFLPLWDGLEYYIPELDISEFHKNVTGYDWDEDSVLEQSFVHYLKTGSPLSLRIAHQMADSMINRMLDKSERYWVDHYLIDLDCHLNRIGYHLGGYRDHRDAVCQFINDILDRWPFLREEIPIINRKARFLEDYDDRCQSKTLRRNPSKIISEGRDGKYVLVDAKTRYRIELGKLVADAINKQQDYIVVGGSAPREPSIMDQFFQTAFAVDAWDTPPEGAIISGGRVLVRHVGRKGLGPTLSVKPYQVGLAWLRVA